MSDVGNVPLDVFQRQFCLVCAQRQCTRSGLNNSAFDQRARNWQEMLFTKVPRADDADPRYSNIRAKLFLPVAGHSSPYEVQGPPPAPPPPPEPVPEPGRPPVLDGEGGAEAEEAPDTDREPILAEDAPTTAVAVATAVQALVNTPFEQGTVLPGAPEPAAPAPTGEVRLGDSGEYVFDDE